MRVGIVTAIMEETIPIISKLGKIVNKDTIAGVKIIEFETDGHTVFLANSGIGEIRAALAVQMLVDLFDIEAVLNFGFVGSINKNIKLGELVVVKKVVHYQFDLSAINKIPAGMYDNRESIYFETDKQIIENLEKTLAKSLEKVIVASGDRFVADSKTKEYLKTTFNADICEMEIAGICIAAERNQIPVFSMKVVSDNANEEAPESFENAIKKGITKYSEIVPQILKILAGAKPSSMPPAITKQ